MPIPTEPIGSVPRPTELVKGIQAFQDGAIAQVELDALYDAAIRDTIARFEATGSPVITDGEQSKASFVTYSIHGAGNIAPDGVAIPFEDGHVRYLPRLTHGPFRYQIYADSYLAVAKHHATVPVKQAVIAASALSLLYPQEEIEGYSRETFIADLVAENETDIRRCFQQGAYNVQIDFTEGRLAVKLDPTRQLLQSFVDLNNQVLERFSAAERQRIGIHTCPGGDQDSTHSGDVDYAELLPMLFEIKVGSFYMQLASESDRAQVLQIVKEHIKPDQRMFVGVIDPINPHMETPEEVCNRVLEAASYIPLNQLGTTDDCGFAPFADDLSTARDIAFEKIQARVVGTALAAKQLGVD